MEPWCWTRARGQGPQGPRASAPSHARVLLLLFLLLLLLLRRPAGELQGALSTAAPGVPCAPRATFPWGGPRFPRQAEATETETTPVSTAKPTLIPEGEERQGALGWGSVLSLCAELAVRQRPVPLLQALTWIGTLGMLDRVGLSVIKLSLSSSACGFSYERDPTLRDPEAMTRRWPWMVSVQANGVHICAGTLIASQWVLAVAHCLTQPRVNYTVRVGSPWIDQMTKTSSDIAVLQVIVHSRYRSERYWSWVGRANDIGLLKLQQVLQYSKYVWPVCLPGLEYEVQDGSICTVTGWGSSKDAMQPSLNGTCPTGFQFQTLQEKEVSILKNRECEDFYHRSSRIPSLVRIMTSQMVCASDTSREQFCYEMTGEPLVCSSENVWYLVGMVSWGAGCKKSEAPPIFLKVSSYQPWIWDHLSGSPGSHTLAMGSPEEAALLRLEEVFLATLARIDSLILKPLLFDDSEPSEPQGRECLRLLRQLHWSAQQLWLVTEQSLHSLRQRLRHPSSTNLKALLLLRRANLVLKAHMEYIDSYTNCVVAQAFQRAAKRRSEYWRSQRKALRQLLSGVSSEGSVGTTLAQALRQPLTQHVQQYVLLLLSLRDRLGEGHPAQEMVMHAVTLFGNLQSFMGQALDQAVATQALWHTLSSRLRDVLCTPVHRLLLDSQDIPVTVTPLRADRVLLFDDALVLLQGHNVHTFDLKLVWVDPGQDGCTLHVITPEEEFSLHARDSQSQ
uniref:Probable threonine protease PRSS50 n=1 Tax=Castor canadensis TaxID=51338 RepID=A0A8B7WDP4_CASCN